MNEEASAFDDENPVSLTLKSGRDFDAAWLVIRGRTVADVARQAELAAEEGHFATIGKADAAFKGLTAAGRELGAAPANKPAASRKATAKGNSADEAQAEASEPAEQAEAEPELIPYKVGFKRKDEFKKAAGMRNAVYRDKVWHIRADAGDDVFRDVEAAGFERKED